jgi:hypothetical protein
METILRGLTYESRLVHLDDIIVIGHTFQEHLLNLQKVFLRFQEARLKLKPEKCQLSQKEVRYLGHVFTRGDNHQLREAGRRTGMGDTDE